MRKRHPEIVDWENRIWENSLPYSSWSLSTEFPFVHLRETYVYQGNGSVEGNGVLGPALLRAENGRDGQGRITQYLEYDAYGGVTHNRYNIVYDARSLVLSESVSQKKVESGGHNSYLTHTSNGYGAGGESRHGSPAER